MAYTPVSKTGGFTAVRVQLPPPAFDLTQPSPSATLLLRKIKMINLSRYLIIPVLSLFLSSAAFAQNTTKTITLKDGSTVKGTILKFENGQYTIQSGSLGEITLNDQDILNIQSGDMPIAVNNAQAAPSVGTSDLHNQVKSMQSTILSDPDLMKEIEGLLDDPQVKQMISDKSFVDDIMSMDKNRLDNNEKVHELMDNPKIQNLMQEIQSKTQSK